MATIENTRLYRETVRVILEDWIVEATMDEFKAWAKGPETKKSFPEAKAPEEEPVSTQVEEPSTQVETPRVGDRPRLQAFPSQGKEGVTRITYKLPESEGGAVIGNARIMGSTIGDIEVGQEYRRQGYGTQIMEDLISRGGKSMIPTNEASRALGAKVGMVDLGHGRMSLPEEKPPDEIFPEIVKARSVNDRSGPCPCFVLKDEAAVISRACAYVDDPEKEV